MAKARLVVGRSKPEPTISDLSDRLNALFARIEALLAREPVTAAVLLWDPTPGEEVAEHLVFRKVGSKWGLFVVPLDGDGDEAGPTTPIASAPRRTRVRAANVVPELRKRIESLRTGERAAVATACEILEAELFGSELDDFPDVPF